MTDNPMVSSVFDYNSFIRMDRFIHDWYWMKTLGYSYIHLYDVTPWVAYIILSLLDFGTQRTSCSYLGYLLIVYCDVAPQCMSHGYDHHIWILHPW